MKRRGCIYKELHNHGRRSNGSQDGNRSSMRMVKAWGCQDAMVIGGWVKSCIRNSVSGVGLTVIKWYVIG